MFNLIYKYRGTVARHEAASLVQERVRYLAHCKEQGAANGTLQLTAQMMLVIIEELDLKEKGRISHSKIVAAADRWATREPQHYNIKHARKARSISFQLQPNGFASWVGFVCARLDNTLTRRWSKSLPIT